MEDVKKEQSGFEKFKDGVKKHKTKIFVGTGVITVGIAGYFGGKEVLKRLKEIKVVGEIVNEGCLKEAMSTVMNKIKYREMKIADISKRNLDEAGQKALLKYKEELKDLYIMLQEFSTRYNNIKIK